MTTGLIVAGGRSTRFGETDKAVAELAGRPLIAHVARGLESSVDQLIVSCRDDQRESISGAVSAVSVPVSVAVDSREVGPLGGVCDGLQASDSEWTFVVGCDFPFVDESVWDVLSAVVTDETDEAVVFRSPDGRVQPLCGRYRTGPAHRESQRLLAAGDRRARQLVDRLTARYVDVAADSDLAAGLDNLNTPAELAAAERRLAASEQG